MNEVCLVGGNCFRARYFKFSKFKNKNNKDTIDMLTIC